MIEAQEYRGPYRWDEARERIPNDYDQTAPPFRGKPMTKEEEADYYEKQSDIELDNLTF